MTVRAFQLNPADDVATLLADAGAGVTVQVAGGPGLTARQDIPRAHKIAVAAVAAGAPVRKFGVTIGVATRPIVAGDWVHLHNLASLHDERSASLDSRTGAPTDTGPAYA